MGRNARDRIPLEARVIAIIDDCGGIAGREGGSRMAMLAPAAGQASAEAHASRLREPAPEQLSLDVAVTTWVEGRTAEEMLQAASARLSLP